LGLTIARAYVQMLKGNIWVKSNPGEGSTFYFTIPYSREENKSLFDQPELHPIGDDKQRKRLNILVVEDDEISSKLIIAYLGKMSESLHLAQSGLEALEIMHNHPEIDLVMMDIRMPGLNGIETTRMIREFNNQVVIVAQTAFGLVGDKERSLEAGCNDWISKPIQKNDLLALIGKYF
jgi:CheY-like chemotaxis protein